jgi:hypothetical protein
MGCQACLIPVTNQFQAITSDSKTLTFEVFLKMGIELGDQGGIEAGRQIVHAAGTEAAEVVMLFAASIVPGGARPVGRRQPGSGANLDKGFQRFVNSCQAYFWDSQADGMEHILGGRMAKFPAELVIDREPLWGAPQAGGLESRSEGIVIERSESHQTGRFLSAIEPRGVSEGSPGHTLNLVPGMTYYCSDA